MNAEQPPESGRWRRSPIWRAIAAILICWGAVSAARTAARYLPTRTKHTIRRYIPDYLLSPQALSFSVLPGPARDLVTPAPTGPAIHLLPTHSDELQRWADVAGNYYSASFRTAFSYDNSNVSIVFNQGQQATLAGQLTATGLKPNFVYQIKLLGDFTRDPENAERIGKIGRWRLPGEGTNYTDTDFAEFADKHLVEAYVFFDFFITDAQGNAQRSFALDHSLHVLWNRDRQISDIPLTHCVAHTVDATNPQVYAVPKQDATTEYIFAEREAVRYQADVPVQLPVGNYQAFLNLTEESFHSSDRDGGFWATVFSQPIEFTIAR